MIEYKNAVGNSGSIFIFQVKITLNLFTIFIFCYNILNAFNWIQDASDRTIMLISQLI